MKIIEKGKNFLTKLQGLPESNKIVILFVTVGIIALIMLFFWVKGLRGTITRIGEDFNKINIGEMLNSGDALETATASDNDLFSQYIENQTEGWQTYTNDKYGFSVKYPLNLSLEENAIAGNFTSVRLKDGEYGVYSFYVGNSEGKNMNEIINLKISDYTSITSEKMDVDGISWSVIEATNIPQNGIGTAGSILNLSTTKQNTTYVLQCIGCNTEIFGDDGVKKSEVFGQIFSTFKFTK